MLLKPDSCVVADADYGDNPNFLAGLETRQEQYVVGVRTDFAVSLRRAGTSRRCRADELLQTVPRWQWRTIRWRRGTKGWLRKKFVALRCWRITSAGQRHEGWLLGERATRGQPEERKYFWSNLPAETTLEELAGYAHRRVLRKNWILTFFQAKAAKNFSQESKPRSSPTLDVGTLSSDNRQGRQPILQRETLAMTRLIRLIHHLGQITCTLLTLLGDGVYYCVLRLRSPAALAAENLFLRKQLALYQERHITPKRATHATLMALVWLGRWFDWRHVLAIVQPATFIRWHRHGFRLLWQWKSRPGRPPLPAKLQMLIRRMARDNPSWGEERIANELLLKLGLRVSPRTIRKYMPKRFDHGRNHGIPSQRWMAFVHNHAKAIVACDFCTVVTASFRLLYVFVVMEHVTRRILHTNVTVHPTGQWTLQQLREAIPCEHGYRFLIHDRDTIFSQALDQRVRYLGLRILKTPVRSPKANAICERLLGTLRRECLDFLIPLTENHLRRLLKAWVPHYNEGRPHMSLGPGIPQPPSSLPVPLQAHRHKIPPDLCVVAHPILGGLHHEYRLEKKAA